MEKNRKTILVTNDDGFRAPGIAALSKALMKIGDVTVVAPDRERSAIGHGFTFMHPLRVNLVKEEKGLKVYSTDGTPTDCIILAIYGIMGKPPDIVVSGINRGANLGDDVTYSGTVAATMEGILQGFPSFAISLTSKEKNDYGPAADFAAKVAGKMMENPLPEGVFLNINVPPVSAEEIEGVSVTFQGRSRYSQTIEKRLDPRGHEYYWIKGEIPQGHMEPGSDFEAVSRKRISVTPLHLSLTREDSIEMLKKWEIFNGGWDVV